MSSQIYLQSVSSSEKSELSHWIFPAAAERLALVSEDEETAGSGKPAMTKEGGEFDVIDMLLGLEVSLETGLGVGLLDAVDAVVAKPADDCE